jgi:hypothetical protein
MNESIHSMDVFGGHEQEFIRGPASENVAFPHVAEKKTGQNLKGRDGLFPARQDIYASSLLFFLISRHERGVPERIGRENVSLR